ncbi:hypothetical protein [Streptomyces sp. NPDC086776]|uniref:hypothetical protein n=1 Tax=Streptomyces sp. NPDC086776 TaxID=3365756 RepID=UPI0037F4CE7A
MTAVAVQIAPRPSAPSPSSKVPAAEPIGAVIVEDIEALTEGIEPGCGEDNPFN